MTYANGRIPLSDLEFLGSGVNGDGYWEHRLSPGTAARWRALVEDVRQATGVTLRISDGWNGYRPYDAQVSAKRKYGGNAAAPGFSSHGGFFNGRESMAIDVANWGQLGKDRFYEFATAHGFTVNYFDWEPWHIIDFAPWAVPAGVVLEEDMNADQDARLTRIEQAVARLAEVVGGSLVGPSVVDLLRTTRDHAKLGREAAEWTKARIGGSAKPGSASFTDLQRQVRDELRGLSGRGDTPDAS